MRNSVVLPVMGVLTVVAVALGLQLGESAIQQIDPAYLQGAPAPLRDVALDRRPVEQPAYAAAYGWAQGEQQRLLDCGDCAATGDRAAFADVYDALPASAGPRPEPAPAIVELADEAQPDTAEWRAYTRYLHYPVNEEQRSAAAALAAPVDEDVEVVEESGEPVGL